MKIMPPLRKAILKQKIAKYLLEDEAVINWSIVKKCMLMLILAAAVLLSRILWKAYVLLSPELWQWVNVPLMKSQLALNALSFLLLLALLQLCRAWQSRRWVRRALPFLSVGLFVISLCREGYLIGILSPAAMISYVSLAAVGLVLLPRSIVYSAFIPVTLYLAGCAYLSYANAVPYAPLFHLDSRSYSNAFWLLSMLWFIAPILFTCLALLEILLSQWRHREQLIQELSQTDPLTSLFNRRSINQRLEHLHQNAGAGYALVLLDLDHFKQINDLHGHNKGAEALIKVSAILRQNLRSSDAAGRFGGEEFILILHESALDQALQAAERCRSAIQQMELLGDDGHPIQVTASFGIAASSPDMRPQQLLTQADKALYEAKACGRNSVRAYLAQAARPAAGI